MKEIEILVCRSPGYWDGSNHSMGKVEYARRHGGILNFEGDGLTGGYCESNQVSLEKKKMKNNPIKNRICPNIKAKHCVDCRHSGVHSEDEMCDLNKKDCPKCIVILDAQRQP